jgi:hypothetical protein
LEYLSQRDWDGRSAGAVGNYFTLRVGMPAAPNQPKSVTLSDVLLTSSSHTINSMIQSRRPAVVNGGCLGCLQTTELRLVCRNLYNAEC